jgi:hypothetical protein
VPLILLGTAAEPASANHKRGGSKNSLVGDTFHIDTPPPKIHCQWFDGKTVAYVCTDGNGYSTPLSTPDDQGQLQSSGNPPSYAVANPQMFDCVAPDVPTRNPSDYTCTYTEGSGRRKLFYRFRLSEMVTMRSDPADPNDRLTEYLYVLPPHRHPTRR